MKLFVSYAHTDADVAEPFINHLRSLRATGDEINVVSDDQIPPGANWESFLRKELSTADAGVLLLSDAFLRSDSCTFEAKTLYGHLPPERVIPVQLKECAWTEVPWLSPHQVLSQKTPICIKRGLDEPRTVRVVKQIWASIKPTETERPPEGYPPAVAAHGPGRDVEWGTLEAALKAGEGRVTLLLGSGIHVPQAAASTAGCLKARIELLREASQDKSQTISYINRVVEERMPGILDQAPLDERDQEPWRYDLLDLQIALANLGSFASSLFAQRMLDEFTAVVNVDSLSVSLPQTESASRFRSLLLDACAKAAALFEHTSLGTESEELGLGLRGIFEQLMALTHLLFFAELSNSEEWDRLTNQLNSGAKVGIRNLRLQKEGRGTLALYQVEWLAHLLWHTLRFDAPIYPKSEELAFQISVCIDQFTPPRRESIGTIASLAVPSLADGGNSIVAYQRLIANIARWLEPAASFGDDPTYRALARILCHPTTSRSKQGHAIPIENLPLAVTTNLDDELELRLQRFKISHHVLFPVYYGRRSQGLPSGVREDLSRDWLLRTLLWVEGEDFPEDTWRLLGTNDLTTEEFYGPLVVKLYGSPRTHINERKIEFSDAKLKTGDERWRFLHRLLVSDIDFLGAMVQKDWWPPDLSGLLYGNPSRLICFLGYTLSDHESRLRLFEQVYRGDRKATTPTVMVSPPKDPIYSYYLERMRADALMEELSYLCNRAMICCDPLQEGNQS